MSSDSLLVPYDILVHFDDCHVIRIGLRYTLANPKWAVDENGFNSCVTSGRSGNTAHRSSFAYDRFPWIVQPEFNEPISLLIYATIRRIERMSRLMHEQTLTSSSAQFVKAIAVIPNFLKLPARDDESHSHHQLLGRRRKAIFDVSAFRYS